jgi:hypothetical protein
MRQIIEAREQGQPIPKTAEDDLITKYEGLLGFVK